MKRLAYWCLTGHSRQSRIGTVAFLYRWCCRTTRESRGRAQIKLKQGKKRKCVRRIIMPNLPSNLWKKAWEHDHSFTCWTLSRSVIFHGLLIHFACIRFWWWQRRAADCEFVVELCCVACILMGVWVQSCRFRFFFRGRSRFNVVAYCGGSASCMMQM